MKKIILWIVLFILIILIFYLWKTNYNKNEKVITKIEEKDNMIIAINYPHTKYKSLNKNIKDYINSSYYYFKDEFSSYKNNNKIELNIDYSYYLLKNKYLCITLYTTIDTHNSEKNYKDIKSFLYDVNKKKEIHLSDIIDNNTLVKSINNNLYYKYNIKTKLDNKIINNSSFSFNDNYLIFYIPSTISNLDFYVINIDLEKFNLKVNKKIIKTSSYENNYVIDPSKKLVALTFDDGPSIYTKDILNILDKYNVTATFFVLGNKVSMYKETLKKVLSNGNEIGNHSYNHKWLIKLNDNELNNQIYDTQNIIKKELGYTPKCLRPTYGSVNDKIKNYKDFNIVLWNIDTLDWKIKNHKKIAKRALQADDGDIILMHDIHKRTVNALNIIIPKLLNEGFQFVTVSELKEAKKIRKLYEKK